jgi:hypothetical protein
MVDGEAMKIDLDPPGSVYAENMIPGQVYKYDYNQESMYVMLVYVVLDVVKVIELGEGTIRSLNRTVKLTPVKVKLVRDNND